MLTTAFFLAASILAGQAEKVPPEQDVASLLQMAAVHSARKQYAEAESCYRKVLETLGEDNKDALKTFILLADAIGRQSNRGVEACDLLEDALKKHRPRLGDDNADVQETIRSIANRCGGIAWTRSIETDASDEDYATALKYATRGVELDPNAGWMVALALARLRSGDAAGSLETMERSLKQGGKEHWMGQFFMMSMAQAANGNKQAARDWYAAACEWMDKERNTLEPLKQLRGQAARTANMSPAFSPDDWSREEYLACFERLIAKQPDNAHLIYRRGVRYAAGKDWGKALADFNRAATLEPENWPVSLSVAILRLFTETSEAEKTKICRELIKKWMNPAQLGQQYGLVLLCSLMPEADLDRKVLLQMAQELVEKQKSNETYILAKGMALYRCGQFEEAIDVLPEPGPRSFGKERLISLLFRAMAHYRVGDTFASRRLLKRAQEDIEQLMKSPDGGPLERFQDRPMAWCTVQMALREAEGLIGADGKKPKPE